MIHGHLSSLVYMDLCTCTIMTILLYCFVITVTSRTSHHSVLYTDRVTVVILHTEVFSQWSFYRALSQWPCYRALPQGSCYRALSQQTCYTSHTNGCVTQVLLQLSCYNGLVTVTEDWSQWSGLLHSFHQWFCYICFVSSFCYTYC